MIVRAIYLAKRLVRRIYHKGQIIFQGEPVVFHMIDEEGRLIILGAYTIKDLEDGLYLDCEPVGEWEYPVQEGNVLTITQVYSATQNGNVLEVE